MPVHKSHPKAATIAQRHDWIANYIKTVGPATFADQAFVDAYIAATGVQVNPEAKGSARCRALQKDLTDMHQCGRLNGKRSGAFFSYTLSPDYEDA